MEEYRVLLVDDEEEIRSGISRKIDWPSLGFTLVGEAANGEEALELCDQLHPDVVLTDIKMPFMDGLELCRRLRQSLPGAKLVVFSGFDDFEYARQAVSMGVSEYILKPINAQELSGVLTRLRELLDAQRLEHRDMEALRRHYEESLPILRELFYTRLLSGQLSPDQIQDRAARYDIHLPPGLWTAALIHADLPDHAADAERDELLLLSVQSFLEKQFSLEDCPFLSVLYGDLPVLLVRLPAPDRLYPLLEELERLSRLSQSYLGVPLTAGVGLPCHGPEELHRSVKGARSALDYRVLKGSGRVIFIGDLEPQVPATLSFEEEDQRTLSAAVKLGTPQQVEQVVGEMMDRLRQAGLSLSQCHLFLLELVAFLLRLTRSGGVAVEAVFGPNFNGSISTDHFSGPEELGRWLRERCLRLQELLGRQRSDSAWRLVEQAKSFIAAHYADSELSVDTVCSHLHLSPTYFSTLFKREVGMPFTTYVTEIRMDEAARLLRDTAEKTYLIAERTGYTDPNYFSYVFKRRFGLSPSKYRSGSNP
ncbi:MAG: response regulator [Oscillospiraceae bacterium]|jgi:two-component system response regulator YesN|nr:response regulator [Oscillospiraceae bacterium]